MSAIYGIYGASGYGKEVYPLVKNQLNDNAKIVFIDDGSDLESLFGCDVLKYDDFLNFKGCHIFFTQIFVFLILK